MSLKKFRLSKFADFEIVSDDKHQEVIGHIRVKPSGILWAPVDAKVWHGVKLDDFARYAEKNGKQQKK